MPRPVLNRGASFAATAELHTLSDTTIVPIAAAFVLSVVLTPLVRAVARRRGLVARPQADRWHQKPTALFGGVAIAVSVMTVCLAAGPDDLSFLAILGASGLLFVVGLIDDLLNIRPYQKLVAQTLAATAVVSVGVVLPWTPFVSVNTAVTLLWLVGITNAVNLLDNMDGLAAGVSAIAGSFLTANLVMNGQVEEAVAVGVFVAALAGFLVYNFNPATIFMGDCGSMFLGMFLAGTSMLSLNGGRLQSLPVLAVPVLVLMIPIFDTTLVAIVRRMSGRAVSQGGRDHTSHRLVALGLSERRAVLMLYALAAVSGLLGLAVRWLPMETAVASVTGLTIMLSIVGIYLAQVSVYDAEEVAAAQRRPLVAFLIDLSYKRRVFEVLLDAVLVVMSWQLAMMIPFRFPGPDHSWMSPGQMAPLLIAVKLPALLLCGVYRGLWRYIGLDSVLVYARAVAISSAVLALVLLLSGRSDSFARTVLLLDGVLLFLMLTGSRFAFRLLRRALPGGDVAFDPAETRYVLIYGAGDGGELLLRELRNNLRWGCRPIAFLDDDPLKRNKVIHGLRVLGDGNALAGICERHRVDEVLISTQKIADSSVAKIADRCGTRGIVVRRMQFRLETVESPPARSPVTVGADGDDSVTRDVLRSPKPR